MCVDHGAAVLTDAPPDGEKKRLCESGRCHTRKQEEKPPKGRLLIFGSSLWSNTCFEAALTIGILPDSVLVGVISAKTHGSHSFIGFLETCSTRRGAVRLRLRSLCWNCSAYKWNQNSKSEYGFCTQHVGLPFKCCCLQAARRT